MELLNEQILYLEKQLMTYDYDILNEHLSDTFSNSEVPETFLIKRHNLMVL